MEQILADATPLTAVLLSGIGWLAVQQTRCWRQIRRNGEQITKIAEKLADK